MKHPLVQDSNNDLWKVRSGFDVVEEYQEFLSEVSTMIVIARTFQGCCGGQSMCPRNLGMLWYGGRKKKKKGRQSCFYAPTPFMLQQQDQFVVFGILSPHEVNEDSVQTHFNPNTHFVVSKEIRDDHNIMPRDRLA